MKCLCCRESYESPRKKKFSAHKGMKQGIVRKYSFTKGGGIIEPDNDKEPNAYFSTETLKQNGINDIWPGVKVKYLLRQDPDVPHRVSVWKIELIDDFLVDLPF